MKRILCFGDSNTWGYIPGDCGRYPEEVRWTGRLQRLLGEDYRVIEAGLNGRTTVFDDPVHDDLCGKQHMPMLLMQSKPLDLVILMIGTNDLKFVGADWAARGAGYLASLCMRANTALLGSSPVFPNGPKVLLVSPIHIGKDILTAHPNGTLGAGDHEDSLRFSEEFARVAKELGVEFFDAATVAEPSPVDCIHLGPEGHAAIADALYSRVLQILGE